jgi:hypothetical protein
MTGTSAYGSERVCTKSARRQLLLERVVHGHHLRRIDPLVVDVRRDADDAARSVVTPMNFITPSVHIRCG